MATIVMQGEGSGQIVASRFQPAAGQRPLQIGRIVFGNWTAGKSAGEELIVCRTAEREFEVHCHGGLAASQNILADLVKAGCEQIRWEEWLKGRHTPDGFWGLRHEAELAMIQAKTLRTAQVLWDQHDGALERACTDVLQQLRDNSTDAALTSLRILANSYALGKHLLQPFRVAITGAPNVGKSSLINAIVGFERSIVHDEAGTTRDVVQVETTIDGWPIELADTAGNRDTHDQLESAGIELAIQAARSADLVVIVTDAAQDVDHAAARLREEFEDALLVANKIDLRKHEAPLDGLPTSATHRNGIQELLEEMTQRLLPFEPEHGMPVVFTARQHRALLQAIEAIQKNDIPAAQRLLESLATI